MSQYQSLGFYMIHRILYYSSVCKYNKSIVYDVSYEPGKSVDMYSCYNSLGIIVTECSVYTSQT